MTGKQDSVEERDLRIAALEERLTRLSEASLSINDGLDLDVVLQRVLDSARSLTGARFGLMTTLDESGKIEDLLASGMTTEEAQALWQMPGGEQIFEYLRSLPGPLRVADFASHVRDLGLPDFLPPTPMTSYLTVPIRHRGYDVGSIHFANGEPGREFSREDEETLVTFASQAALVIANARRYREELRSRTSLETLVETTPVAVAVFDARTGMPVSFNQEMMRIVDALREPHQGPEQLLETMTCRRLDGSEVSLKEWPLSESLAVGETVRTEEIVLSVPDGRKVTALLNATPVRAEDGGVESFVVTLQDLAPLEDLERLRAEFLGMVSHELRTPLTSIRGSATTMQEAAADLDVTELRQFLRIIVDQADNMRELIDDLLDVARIKTGALPVSPEPSQLAQMVDRARNTFLIGGGRNNIEIRLEPELPLVMADRRRIGQVIGNLLTNAAKNSPESSVIRVTAELRGVFVAVTVTDQGRGIPSDQLPGLFRKFPVDPGRDPVSGNTGMGLSICRGIVEAHCGRIWAESDGPGLGARFTFTIPMAEVSAAELRAAISPDDDQAVGDCVLVVDDDPSTLMYARRALSNGGYRSIVAADPDEALVLMQEHQPRLILLDMMLPGGQDGIDLMKSMFRIAETPVIFLSAYGQEEIITRAFDAGAVDYVVKPFSPTELVARVRAALRRGEDSYRFGLTEPYTLGDLVINYADRNVYLDGVPIYLTATEYALLFELSVNAGRVITHDQLLRRVWSPSKPGDIRALRTLMRRLRRKLNDDANNPTYIFSQARVGYRMPRREVGAPA